ncbi:restriction endonuclease subunit S [Hyphomicrobium sulfonivorans]|uniref:restriction endonuclease subunit S n=1 Tax=Hyphomicrobium sulfonivorans TaxID=121290 RepID=UPI00157101AD|nr:restriction endonuclease subunit S [Hyphomicrobium sulfonivorans]MBI1651170.1 restriction endonuclease subunit S [Hyphomicrobium sulfonivorans]NSL72446.1 hypothetical protein [Hyphomicrobium sulfonivorans]
MRALPQGWHLATLEEIISVRNGFAFKSADFCSAGVPVVRQSNLTGTTVDLSDCVYVSETIAKACSNFRVQRGDLLLGMSGSIGEPSTYLYEFDALQNQRTGLIRFFVDDDAHRCFVKHALAFFEREYVARGKGIGVQNVSSKDIERTEVPLPPLPEQRRIVAKIDSLSAKSRRARDHLDHIPRLVDKYKQAILAAAFRGELTREWRQVHGTQHPWETIPAGGVIQDVVAGKNLRCEERPPAPHERGVVKVSAVTWGSFDPQATKTLPADFCPLDHTRIQSGDFLISRANTLELVGAVVIVQDTPPNLFLSDKILRLEMEEGAKRWMLWFLRSPSGRAAIEEAATGNQLSMRNLSQVALREIDIPWPNERERVEIVRRIETAFAGIDRLSDEATSARKLIDHLDQAVLTKAFRGELVPQDPSDEPASALLKRIRAERAAGKSGKRKTERA